MLKNIFKLIKYTGNILMTFYNNQKSLNVSYKLDQSPVTNADQIANDIICKQLKILFPNIPVLSEECLPHWNQYQYWNKYWLIDPIDGTKEFLYGNKEFSVNIALIENGTPILGVIYIPYFDTLYYADNKHTWKEKNNKIQKIYIKHLHPPIVAISRSHPDQNINKYLNVIGDHKIIKVGSSLKFCLVAEGRAQIYLRLGTTNIWDTGAGEIIVRSAGGVVIGLDNKLLNYTPKKVFSNSSFYVGTSKFIHLINSNIV
ncbi:MAG TPA: 3'(2'),5'-bisphosphate nucleotidase CysQ [Buchnera sp. (in: enterobacteria)]|nr:3'(2'),5'-bisphosphate nucleotidase CysQ [Buchnera sp. (in: enterobacteria)]